MLQAPPSEMVRQHCCSFAAKRPPRVVVTKESGSQRGRFDAHLPGSHLQLSTQDTKHLLKVLRMRQGDTVEVTDGEGHIANAALHITPRGKGASVELLGQPVVAPEAAMKVSVAAAIGSLGNRSDWAIEKLCELGCAELVPLITQYSRDHTGNQAMSRTERWRRLSVSASKQCLRTRALHIHEPEGLPSFLASHTAFKQSEFACFGDANGAALRDSLPVDSGISHICLVVGPESGLSDDEQHILRTNGCPGVFISEQRLRAETAVISLLAGSLALCGV